MPEIDRDQISEVQKSDPSLKRVKELAEIEDQKLSKYGANSKFFWLKDVLYREFKSPKLDFGQPCTQLVVPSKFRAHVMKVAHGERYFYFPKLQRAELLLENNRL